MTTVYGLGRLFSLRLSVEPLAIAGSVALLALLSIVAIVVLGFPIGAAVVGALIAVVLHWLSEIVHNLGHAWAARSTGYPMAGIQLGRLAIFGTCLYPPNEPALPARVHIRRALGGPAASLLLSIIAAAILVTLGVSNHAVLWWVALFFFLDNFVVLALGAFLPLGFTDGSTLLYWWGKR
jgi:hypothetical protein